MAEMSSYKLTYFDGRGRAEIIRLVFVITGTAFEDNRVPIDEGRKTWLALKPTIPFERLPELEVDGHRIPQSKTIERFLAKRFGLNGTNEFEEAAVDGFSEQVRDITIGYNMAKGDETKLGKFWSTEFPDYLHILAKNAGNNGHFVGNKLTLPDVQFYYTMATYFDALDKVNACLSKYENLRKIVDNVANNDKIKEYVSKRKVTPF
eukprot:Phypoly_transcript_20719.p1 GENE.Phypoly_transcript_20719~~Phypoly_transcript_20719.p1  ORF type:complete len:216 (+),score=40.99 Phypoly_transcript_20719:31-648(+)